MICSFTVWLQSWFALAWYIVKCIDQLRRREEHGLTVKVPRPHSSRIQNGARCCKSCDLLNFLCFPRYSDLRRDRLDMFSVPKKQRVLGLTWAIFMTCCSTVDSVWRIINDRSVVRNSRVNQWLSTSGRTFLLIVTHSWLVSMIAKPTNLFLTQHKPDERVAVCWSFQTSTRHWQDVKWTKMNL